MVNDRQGSFTDAEEHVICSRGRLDQTRQLFQGILPCLQASNSGKASAGLDNLPPVKHRSRASQEGPGSTSSKDRCKLGSPIKMPAIAVRRLSLSSTAADPLEGNSNFQLLQALTPGASSSVFLCLDLRDQVRKCKNNAQSDWLDNTTVFKSSAVYSCG